MEIEITKQLIEQYTEIIKRLSKDKPEQFIQHLPNNLLDILVYFHITNSQFDELDTFYENINKYADLPNNRDILLPIVTLFLQILFSENNTNQKNNTNFSQKSEFSTEPRELTNAEVSAIHYFLLNPNCDLLQFEMFAETMYKRPKVKNTLLRMFFFWNGCLCLQYKSIERAEFMFNQCVTMPTKLDKPSKVGLEAAKKLLLLRVSRGSRAEIASPYNHFIPQSYLSFAERCLKLQLSELNRIIADEDIFRKDGNSSMIEYVYKQIQFLHLEKIAKAYSVISIIQLKNKCGLTEAEIADVVKMAAVEKGKDWVYIKEERTVHFGLMNRNEPIGNQAKMVKDNGNLIVEACEYIDRKREAIREEKETKEARGKK